MSTCKDYRRNILPRNFLSNAQISCIRPNMPKQGIWISYLLILPWNLNTISKCYTKLEYSFLGATKFEYFSRNVSWNLNTFLAKKEAAASQVYPVVLQMLLFLHFILFSYKLETPNRLSAMQTASIIATVLTISVHHEEAAFSPVPRNHNVVVQNC